MSAVHNERVKLAASAVSNLGVAIAVTGAVTPVVSVLYGMVPFSFTLFKAGPSLLLIGIAFHILAQRFLGRLKDV